MRSDRKLNICKQIYLNVSIAANVYMHGTGLVVESE
jgi:hypothetical protein